MTTAEHLVLPEREPNPERPLIDAVDVGKKFARFHRRATSLKERLVRREQGAKEDFWALRDVTLQVHAGETVGITGPNGSGKSTLLKVLSGILRSTTGEVAVRGRVASLLELGAGFDGELTGRENVYLNSALLGVPRAETDRLFDQIVEFSELGEFIDNPVKHYSSGMYVRLGFAVAVHVDPDLLIIDEVLAVGDAAFQQKCIDRIRLFQRQGKTILFVSHSSGQIASLCTRAILLDHGRVLFDGPAKETVERLNRLLGVDTVERRHEGLLRIASAMLVDPTSGTQPETFRAGSAADFRAVLEWLTPSPLSAPVELDLAFVVGGDPVVQVGPDVYTLPADAPTQSHGSTTIEWSLPALPDVVGEVGVRLSVRSDDVLLATGEITGIRIVRDDLVSVAGHPRVVPLAARPADAPDRP